MSETDKKNTENTGNIENKSVKSKVIIGAIAAVALVVIGVALFFVFRKDDTKIESSSMRILRTVGEVKLEADGQSKTIMENMRLSSGNAITTGDKSLASIGLDDYKIINLEEKSRAEFYQDGKNLELNLTEGSLFFDIRKPLDDTENLDIKTSTMIVGIRGTSGYFFANKQKNEQYLIITDGHVVVKVEDPETGQLVDKEVGPGGMITTVVDENGKTKNIVIDKITDINDLPISLLREIANNADTMERICNATGFDAEKIIEIVESSTEDYYITEDTDPTPTPTPTGEVSDTDDGIEKIIVKEGELTEINIQDGTGGEGETIPGTPIEIIVENRDDLPGLVLNPTPTPTPAPVASTADGEGGGTTPTPTPTPGPTEEETDPTPSVTPPAEPTVAPTEEVVEEVTSWSIANGGSQVITVGDNSVTFNYSGVGESTASIERNGNDFKLEVNYEYSPTSSSMVKVNVSSGDSSMAPIYYACGSETFASTIPASAVTGDSVTISVESGVSSCSVNAASPIVYNCGASGNPDKNVSFQAKDSTGVMSLAYDSANNNVVFTPASGTPAATSKLGLYTSATETTTTLKYACANSKYTVPISALSASSYYLATSTPQEYTVGGSISSVEVPIGESTVTFNSNSDNTITILKDDGTITFSVDVPYGDLFYDIRVVDRVVDGESGQNFDYTRKAYMSSAGGNVTLDIPESSFGDYTNMTIYSSRDGSSDSGPSFNVVQCAKVTFANGKTIEFKRGSGEYDSYPISVMFPAYSSNPDFGADDIILGPSGYSPDSDNEYKVEADYGTSKKVSAGNIGGQCRMSGGCAFLDELTDGSTVTLTVTDFLPYTIGATSSAVIPVGNRSVTFANSNLEGDVTVTKDDGVIIISAECSSTPSDFYQISLSNLDASDGPIGCASWYKASTGTHSLRISEYSLSEYISDDTPIQWVISVQSNTASAVLKYDLCYAYVSRESGDDIEFCTDGPQATLAVNSDGNYVISGIREDATNLDFEFENQTAYSTSANGGSSIVSKTEFLRAIDTNSTAELLLAQ